MSISFQTNSTRKQLNRMHIKGDEFEVFVEALLEAETPANI